MFDLRDKLKKLIPLLDRLNYEFSQLEKATTASEHSIRHLLYLNKSMRVYAEDGEKVQRILKSFNDLYKHEGEREFMEFVVKYIDKCSVTLKLE